MLKKRSQITLFIIIGIVILIVFGFLFLVLDLKKSELDEDSFQEGYFEQGDIEAVKSFVQGCVDKASKEVVILVGKHGGYAYLNDAPSYLSSEEYNASFAYHSRANVFIKESDMLRQISKYTENEIPLCLDSFNLFIERGFSFDDSEIISNATLSEKRVLVSVSYPFTVRKGNSVSKMGYFKGIVPVDLKTIYYAVNDTVNKKVEDSEVDIALYLLDYFNRVVVQPTENNANFYILNNSKFKLDNLDYQFIFATNETI